MVHKNNMKTLLPVLLLLAFAFTASAFEFTGKVVGVYDGDTITVLRGKERVRVRISAVDCPEVRAYFGKGGQQPYSRQATQFTEKLVDGKRVKVKAVGNSRDRLVGIVMLPDGRDLHAYVFKNIHFHHCVYSESTYYQNNVRVR